MIHKLSAACYAIRSVVHISNMNTFISVYYAYFHSIIKYGRIFWSNSPNSGNIFTLQNKILRITAGAEPRTSCRSLFKQLEILPVPRQNTPSLMSFIINNQEIFQINSPIHNINTRNKHNLQRPNANLSSFQRSIFSAGIKIFNSLSLTVTILRCDMEKFKATLRKHTHSFYSVDEFITCKENL